MAEWACQRDGACCTRPQAVVMTTAEWRELANKTPLRPVALDQSRDGWVALKAAPCPFYDLYAKACTVYESRPYNCRIFMCGRWNAHAQPFVDETVPVYVRSDNQLRMLYRKGERAHRPWAESHGWAR